MTAPTRSCPTCGVTFAGTECLDDPAAMPDPGDFSICIKCRALAVFADDLSLREPTDAELIELTDCGEGAIAEAIAAIQRRHAANKP